MYFSAQAVIALSVLFAAFGIKHVAAAPGARRSNLGEVKATSGDGENVSGGTVTYASHQECCNILNLIESDCNPTTLLALLANNAGDGGDSESGHVAGGLLTSRKETLVSSGKAGKAVGGDVVKVPCQPYLNLISGNGGYGGRTKSGPVEALNQID